MTNNIGARVWLIDVSQILLIGVFLYSAISKILDYDDFYNNLMRSPLFEAEEVAVVSYSIIIVELVTVAMLIVSKTTRFAFALAFFLLVSFSSHCRSCFLSGYTMSLRRIAQQIGFRISYHN